MTLEEVMMKADFPNLGWGSLSPDMKRSYTCHANAVRAFLGSDEVVAAGREAILENLRDRRLLKWLFAEDPENHGAIGYVDGPIDAETQNECAESLARSALSSIGGE